VRPNARSQFDETSGMGTLRQDQAVPALQGTSRRQENAQKMSSNANPNLLKNEYLLITRCRAFHSWPNHGAVFQTPWKPIAISDSTPRKDAFFRYQVGTSYSPVLWTLDYAACNYPVADRMVVAGGKTRTVSPKAIELEQDMIDLCLCIKSDSQISATDCETIFAPVLDYFVAFVGAHTEDTLLPVVSNYPIEIVHQPDGKTQISTLERPFTADIRETREVAKEELIGVMQALMSLERSSTSTKEERELVRIASRRYLSALIDSSIVWRFLGFWQVCELLAPPGSKRTGRGIVSRISYALAGQLGISKSRLDRYIQPYYKMRGDIVHAAVESPANLREAAMTVEVLAAQMIKGRLGLGMQRKGTLQKFVASVKGQAE
jgi:hypothetical protein